MHLSLSFCAWFWGARGSFWVIHQLGKWLRAVFRGFIIVLIIFDWFLLGMILESELGLWFLYIVHSPHYEGSSFRFIFLCIADFELIVRANLYQRFFSIGYRDSVVPSHWFSCNIVDSLLSCCVFLHLSYIPYCRFESW